MSPAVQDDAGDNQGQQQRDNVFKALTFNGDSGWTNDQKQVGTVGGTVYTSSALNNVTLINSANLKLYRCPSDPKPNLIRNDSNVRDASGNESILVNRNSYVAARRSRGSSHDKCSFTQCLPLILRA